MRAHRLPGDRGSGGEEAANVHPDRAGKPRRLHEQAERNRRISGSVRERQLQLEETGDGECCHETVEQREGEAENDERRIAANHGIAFIEPEPA